MTTMNELDIIQALYFCFIYHFEKTYKNGRLMYLRVIFLVIFAFDNAFHDSETFTAKKNRINFFKKMSSTPVTSISTRCRIVY